MTGCTLSLLESSYWLRAEGDDGFKLEGAALSSITVLFDETTGEILSVEIECHPDTPPEIQEQVARLFLHLDLCIDNPQP